MHDVAFRVVLDDRRRGYRQGAERGLLRFVRAIERDYMATRIETAGADAACDPLTCYPAGVRGSWQRLGPEGIDGVPRCRLVSLRLRHRLHDRQRKSEEASIEIIVKNIRNEAVNVRLVEQIHGDWIVRDASEDYIKKDASTIHFSLSLEAHGSKTVTYTYRKEWK